MGLNFFQRRRILKGVNYMNLTPIRFKQHEDIEDGTVAIIFPKFKNERLQSFLVPGNKSKFIRIKLDELGTASWLAIDGKKTVKDICDLLENKFGERIQPVEERTTKFFTSLYEQRYISFKELIKDR